MKPFGMQIQVVGVNHSTTPIKVREKLAVSSKQFAAALLLLRDYVSQGLILSTCNRTEVYSVSSSSSSIQSGNVAFLKAWAKAFAELVPNQR